MGRAAADGGGGTTAGVIGGRRSFSEVAGAPPVLRGQLGASLAVPEREMVFWVVCCGAEVAGVGYCSLG